MNWLPLIEHGVPLECRIAVDPALAPVLVCQRFHLPRSWRERSYAVIVEEFEPMVADGQLYDQHVVVDRGPMFACTVPISIQSHAPICRNESDDIRDLLRIEGDLVD